MVYINEEARSANKGPILALMKLLKVRNEEGVGDLAFAAGLPNHNMPDEVLEEKQRAAMIKLIGYLKYDPESIYSEEKLHPAVADFHAKMFGLEVDNKDVIISPGSTPVLTSVAYITQTKTANSFSRDEQGRKVIGYDRTQAMVINPTYPLITPPVTRAGGTLNRTARLVTGLDIDPSSGSPFQTNGRWNLDMASFNKALDQGRTHADEGGTTMLYLNFPGNPTGYAPTLEEYGAIVNALADDLEQRKAIGIEGFAVLEDIAYATMMHDGRQYQTMHNAIEAVAKGASAQRRDILEELEHSIVVAHSFSKAFSVAGDRVAYCMSRDRELLSCVYNQIIDMILTPPAGTLVTLLGALNAGEVNQDAMQDYNRRLRHFERRYNETVGDWLVEGADSSVSRLNSILGSKKPVPAAADAGFFSATNGNFLKGAKISSAKVDELKGQIAKISDQDLQNLLLKDLFKDNQVNTPMDASLWLMAHANVVSIPMYQANGSTDIKLRFSTGQTSIADIEEGVNRMGKAFKEHLPTPQQAVLSR